MRDAAQVLYGKKPSPAPTDAGFERQRDGRWAHRPDAEQSAPTSAHVVGASPLAQYRDDAALRASGRDPVAERQAARDAEQAVLDAKDAARIDVRLADAKRAAQAQRAISAAQAIRARGDEPEALQS